MSWPELRAVPWYGLAATVATASGVVVVSWPSVLGQDGPPLLWSALGALAAATAISLDDPAAAITAATPTSRRRRTLQRLVVMTALIVVWTITVAVLAAGSRAQLSAFAMTITGAGVLLATAAVADVVRRLGDNSPGSLVGPLVFLSTVGCIIFRPVSGDLQILQANDGWCASTAFWTVVSVLAVSALSWSTRDRSVR